MSIRRFFIAAIGLSAMALLPVSAAEDAGTSTVDAVHSKHEAPQVDKASGPGWPALSLSLANEDKNARRKWATVLVDVKNVELIDPASVNEKPQDQQGHLHYRLNDGPVIATTATKLSFHDLQSGTHTCTVMLAGNDHAPLGPQETVTIKIP